jgi:hypothetical protein
MNKLPLVVPLILMLVLVVELEVLIVLVVVSVGTSNTISTVIVYELRKRAIIVSIVAVRYLSFQRCNHFKVRRRINLKHRP